MASVGGVLYTLTVIKKRPGVRALKLRGFTYHNLIIGSLYRSLNCMSVIASTRSRNAACPVIPPVHTDPALAHAALQAARKGPESGANQTSSSLLGMSEMYCFQSIYGKGKIGSQRFDFEFNRSAFLPRHQHMLNCKLSSFHNSSY